MSETTQFQSDEEAYKDVQRYLTFGEHVEKLRDYGGPYTRAFNTSFADQFMNNPALQTVIFDFMTTERGSTQLPRNLAMKNIKAVQAIYVAKHEAAHAEGIWTPKGLDFPEAWRKHINRIHSDKNFMAQYEYHMLNPNAANIPRRSVVYAATLALMGIEDSVTVLDIGSSTNNSLKVLTLPKEGLSNFTSIDVMHPNKQDVDEDRSQGLQRLISEHDIELAYGLGIDILDWPNNPRLASKIRSDSFYLEELFNTELVRQYDELRAANPANVHYRVLDAALNYANKEKLKREGTEDPEFEAAFDVVYLSTMLYQLESQKRLQVLANAHRWTKPGGLIVIQDFVDITPKGMRFYSQHQWKWKYNVWVKDLSRPRPKFKKLLNVESGRAQRLILEPLVGKLAIAGDYGLH